MSFFVVAYAKVSVDKRDVVFHGVYFGGITESKADADALAIQCINNTKKSAILPRVIELDDDALILEGLYEASRIFETIIQNMMDAAAVMSCKR